MNDLEKRFNELTDKVCMVNGEGQQLMARYNAWLNGIDFDLDGFSPEAIELFNILTIGAEHYIWKGIEPDA